jgi:hypothetical protein
MLLAQFDPPGNVPDLAPGSPERQAWSDFISGTFDGNIGSVEGTIGAGNCQLYNPTHVETTEPAAELTVTWNGFPMRFVRGHRDNRVEAWREADDFRPGIARRQDEYLEWFVYKNAAGTITRVDFTCEAWDYWNFLGQHAPAQVLALYQTHINPAITNADLFPGGSYNRLNQWNTELGAMHLSHNANTLGAEINLVTFATVLWENGGRLVTDPLQTIRCGGFGDEIRSSDPRIGWDINNLARLGFAITLKNPVGLLIDGIDDTGFLKPDGSPVGDYWRVLRGFAGGTVRATYEVPAGEGFVVGDITIGGQNIEYGGQLAEHVTMKVVGVACRPGSFSNTPQSCGVPGPAFSRMAAPGTPLRYTRLGAVED